MSDKEIVDAPAPEPAPVPPTLGLAEMLDGPDQEFRYVPTPEWKANSRVRIASLTAEELLEYVEDNENAERRKTAVYRLLARSLVDDAGARIATEKDAIAFAKRKGAVVERIIRAVLEMNGMDQAMAARLGNASSGAASVASPTGSPATSGAST